jgi:hypothetical protein
MTSTPVRFSMPSYPSVRPAAPGRGGRQDPPSAHHNFVLSDRDNTLEWIHNTLYVATGEQAEHEASPTAAIIDSQTS